MFFFHFPPWHLAGLFRVILKQVAPHCVLIFRKGGKSPRERLPPTPPRCCCWLPFKTPRFAVGARPLGLLNCPFFFYPNSLALGRPRPSGAVLLTPEIFLSFFFPPPFSRSTAGPSYGLWIGIAPVSRHKMFFLRADYGPPSREFFPPTGAFLSWFAVGEVTGALQSRCLLSFFLGGGPRLPFGLRDYLRQDLGPSSVGSSYSVHCLRSSPFIPSHDPLQVPLRDDCIPFFFDPPRRIFFF